MTAPKGARITVKGSGKGCPRKSIATAARSPTSSSSSAIARGHKLRITVTRPGFICKVTTITIRKGKAPLRSDQCQVPGEKKLLRC